MSKTTITLGTVVRQARGIGASALDGKVVMISERKGKYYGLDAVGSRIWSLLEEPCSVAELCDALHKSFEVDRRQLEDDVIAFVTHLADERLLELA